MESPSKVDSAVQSGKTAPAQCESENEKSTPEKAKSGDSQGQEESEFEPAASEKTVAHRKSTNRKFRGNQGKTVHPRQRLPPKELRELSRKHALLEKNLKIEGMPAQPKFRKRRLSVGSSTGRPHEKDSPYKRKRLASIDSRRSDHMPKWELMGGDAQDPLNLNGLADSEEGRLLNLKTPESSPLPTPEFRKVVYVKVPPNIEDPLNLEGKHDQDELDRLLNATIKKRHRTKKRKHEDTQQASTTAEASTAAGTTSADPAGSSVAVTEKLDAEVKTEGTLAEDGSQNTGAETDSAKPKSEQSTPKNPASEQSTPKKAQSEQSTPKKAQALGAGRSRSRSISMSPERRFKRQLSGSAGKGRPTPAPPQFKYPEKPKFTQGNYNRYYGYRNSGGVTDPRLQYFNLKWFKGKDVLDIGCNAGHLTLALADQYQPHKILGMDIDGKLIQAARQNIRHILSQRRKDSTKYPTVHEMTRGPLEAHPLMGSSDQFPNNVLFLQGNYVPGSEEILNLQKEEYDTILALSITKWIHLNNGDNGLKLFFRKIFRQLRPGGKLILEPQPWSTYRKRAKLTPELFSNYQSIKLKPEGFKHYLLSVGFVKCEVIGIPVVKAKGFRRPLLLFTKQDNRQAASPSLSVVEQIDYSNICQECGREDKTLCDHPQFAGMRRGPYASYMYDHVNYRSYASDSPMFGTHRANSSHSFSNSFGGYGGGPFFDPPGDFRDLGMDHSYEGGFMGRWPSFGGDSEHGGHRGPHVVSASNSMYSRSSSRSGQSIVSADGAGSSHSWTSSVSGSQSGSSSTSSTPASRSSSASGSYYSPEPHGPNGGVEGQFDNVPAEEAPAFANGDLGPGDNEQPVVNGDLSGSDQEQPVLNGDLSENEEAPAVNGDLSDYEEAPVVYGDLSGGEDDIPALPVVQFNVGGPNGDVANVDEAIHGGVALVGAGNGNDGAAMEGMVEEAVAPVPENGLDAGEQDMH